MSEMNSRLPKSAPVNWTKHISESMARALERRHLLDLQQRTFQRDSCSPKATAKSRPRRPA
jgi:hypothetical protein